MGIYYIKFYTHTQISNFAKLKMLSLFVFTCNAT